MLEAAGTGQFDVIVAVDLDRLLRQTKDLVTLIEAGAKVVTLDGEIDLSTPDGELRATMLTAFARFEVRHKAERRRRANARRRDEAHTDDGRAQDPRVHARRAGRHRRGGRVRQEASSMTFWPASR